MSEFCCSVSVVRMSGTCADNCNAVGKDNIMQADSLSLNCSIKSDGFFLNVRYSCISVIWRLLSVSQWHFFWLKHNEGTSQLLFLAFVAVSRSISLRIPFETFTYGTHIALFGVREAPVWISITYSICHSKQLQRLVRGPWNGAAASRSFSSCRYGAQVREWESFTLWLPC